MQTIEQIRNLFPAMGILVSDGVISLVMPSPNDSGVMQEISAERNNKDAFIRLLLASEKLGFSIIPKKLLSRLDFYTNTDGLNGGVFYLPLEKNITPDELEQILIESGGGEYHPEIETQLAMAFAPADLTDGIDVRVGLAIFSEMQHYKKLNDDGEFEPENKIMSFDDVAKWMGYRKILTEVQQALPEISLEFEDPSADNSDGYAFCCIESDTENSWVFENQKFEMLKKLFSASSIIAIEAGTENGTTGINFTMFA